MAETMQKLAADVGVLVADTKDLVKATAAETGGKIQQTVATVRPRLAEAGTMLREKTTGAMESTDGFVRDRPWAAMGVAAGIGMVIGLLISRN